MASFDNNYNRFKEDFKTDTGLEAESNIQTYISYYNARIADNTLQILSFLTKSISSTNTNLEKIITDGVYAANLLSD